MDRLKRIVKKTPVVRDIARAVRARLAARKVADFSSARYWEDRYRDRRTSGAGSYNRLASFKADVINHFVADHGVASVIDFGCGDGSQLRSANYPAYVGIDVSRTVLDATRAMFAADATKAFVHAENLESQHEAELSLSLDVVYHLVEDDAFEPYMAQLFDAATRFVIIYSSNDERPSDSAHVRHRKFTDWVELKRPEFRQIGFVKNAYPEDIRDLDNTSFADFYFFERIDVGR